MINGNLNSISGRRGKPGQPIVIVTQPQNTDIPSGGNGTVHVVATGTNVQYNWQISFGRGGYSDIVADSVYSTVKTNTLTVTGLTASVGIRCRLTSDYDPGNTFTNNINLTATL